MENRFKKLMMLLMLFFIFNKSEAQNFAWAKQMGGMGDDFGFAMCKNHSNQIICTGTFRDTVDFDPSPAEFKLSSLGGDDTYISKFTSNGNLVWAKKIGGTFHDISTNIKTDAADNIYISGYFYGVCDFDPGIGTVLLTSNTPMANDAFLLKLDADGNFVWVKQVAGANTEKATAMAVDPNGFVYYAGYYGATIDFDPNAGVFDMTSAGNADIFVVKLDTAGNFIWSKSMGGIDAEFIHSMALDPLGNIYLAGIFGSTADFDPSASVQDLVPLGSYDIYFVKLDTSGTLVWAKSIGGLGDDEPASIAIDELGNVYCTGYFENTVDFDPNIGVANLTTIGYLNPFVLKLSTNGDYVWSKAFTGSYAETFSITLDDASNVYTSGYFQDSIDFNPGIGVNMLTAMMSGSYDAFVSKLDSSGNFVWVKQVTSVNSAAGKGLLIDDVGSLYVTGYFYDTTYMNPGSSGSMLISNGGYDAFILKYSCSIETAVTQSANTLSALATGANYQWINCATHNALVGENNVSYTATTTGSYAVIVKQDACIDTSTCYSIEIIGIAETGANSNIEVYPNPTQGLIHVSGLEEGSTYQITDLQSKILLQGIHNSSVLNINIENLSSGVYLLQSTSKQGFQHVSKIIKN